MFDGSEAVISNLSDSADSKFVATIQLDAYPVHFSAVNGTVSVVECGNVSKLLITQEVLIPVILESAFNSSLEKAMKFAKKYSNTAFFTPSLETLLYKAVTGDSPTTNSLTDVISLILTFPLNFNAIVAGCARKIETKYWPKLFEA
ncbi:hypothetical protein FF38_07743, partial [Lucilia cuprina]